nr:fimbrial protein [Escherichia coli]
MGVTCDGVRHILTEIIAVNVVDNDVAKLNFDRLTITCDPDVRDDAWEMSLTWTGSQTPYDDSAIETDVSGLGIELQQNGQPFKLGTPLKIDPSTPPTLQAVPVKANDAALSDGTFSAYATLQVDYQ